MTVFCMNQYIRMGTVQLASALYPFVTEVYIQPFEGFVNSELLGLLALKVLRKLEILVDLSKRAACLITFDGGVRPLLSGLGRSLTFLCIRGLRTISIGFIIEHCLNLRFLSVKCNQSYLSSERPFSSKRLKTETHVLKNLKILEIADDNSNELFDPISPAQDLFSLLSSPSLKNLSVCSQTLTDDLLRDAANVHGFQHLEKVYFCRCENVTISGINLFMKEGSILSKIEFMSIRPSISKQNVDQ